MNVAKRGLQFGAAAVVGGLVIYTTYRKVFCREIKISANVNRLFNHNNTHDFTDEALKSRFVVHRLTEKNSTQAARDAAVDCLTRSFAGTTTTAPEGVADWAYCARTENIHEPLAEPPTAERLAFFRFMATWTFYFTLPRGGVYCLVSKESSMHQQQKIVAVTCTIAPGQTRPWDMGYGEMFRLIGKTGAPPKTEFKGSMRRLEALGDAMAAMQSKLYPPSTKRPLYVWMFGTDPECQGRGCGSALLSFIGAVADADGVETYLETDGARNESFYARKGGFETRSKTPVESKGQRFDHDGGGIAMVRPAKS